MGFGVLRPKPLGAVTAPTTIGLATPSSVISGAFPSWGSVEAIQLPSVGAVVWTHGNTAQRYSIEGSCLLLGLLAPPGGMTAGDHGSGTLANGDYQYGVSQFRSLDGALSGVSIESIDIKKRTLGGALLAYSNTTGHTVDLASIPALVTRDATDLKRVMRTLAGADLLFKIVDQTGATYTDGATDASLSGPGAFQYDETKYRPREAGYPVVGRHGVFWRGRLWTAGVHRVNDYTAGKAVFTNGSATVTFTGEGRPKTDMIGRFIRRTADTFTEYQIVAVDEATPSVTLSQPFMETSNVVGADHRIRDLRDPYELFYTEPNLPNNSPPTNSIKGIAGKDPHGVTALAVLGDRLVAFTRTDLYTVTGDTGAWQFHHVGGGGYGAFGGGSVVATMRGLYWVGPDGFFAWTDPDVLPVSLSKPENDDTAGIQGTVDAINGDEAEGIIAAYNSSTQRIRWWLPIDGAVFNTTCVRFDLQTRTFATHTSPPVTAAVTIPSGPGSRAVTVIGTLRGGIHQIEAGWIDGAFGFEPVQAVSSYAAATRTLTVVGTPLPTSGNGLKGVSAILLPASGPPYQIAHIVSNTSSTVAFAAPLDTAPAAGDIVMFGVIPLDAETPWFDYSQPEMRKWVEGLTLAHEVEDEATEVWCGVAADTGDPETLNVSGTNEPPAALMDQEDGEFHFELSSRMGRSLKLRFLAFARGHKIRLRGYVPLIRFPIPTEVVP